MVAFPAGCCWLFPLSCLCPAPLAYYTLIFLPIWSDPFNYKAFATADLVENLTNANPFGFPSGLFINFTFRIFPQPLNKSLISESYALKDKPCTATSNYPYYSYCSTFWGYSTFGWTFPFFLVTSAEPFLFAGFYSYSYDYTFFSTFLAWTAFFFAGSGFYSSSSELYFFRVLPLIYLEAFLGFGF